MTLVPPPTPALEPAESTRTREPEAIVRDARQSAFDATAPARAMLADKDLEPYTLDAVFASAQAMGTADRVGFLRSELAQLRGFELTHFTSLGDYASALLHTQATIAARAQRTTLLVEHATAGMKLRQLFFGYCDLLVLKDKLDAALVARLKEGSGYRDLLEDLATLVHLFHAHPTFTREGSLITEAEVSAASQLVEQLTLELGERNDLDTDMAALLMERRRAATVLLHAYSEVQAAVLWLRRREGDASRLAPTLYVPRSSRGGKDAVLPTPAATAPAANPAAGPAAAVPTSATAKTGLDNPFITPRT